MDGSTFKEGQLGGAGEYVSYGQKEGVEIMRYKHAGDGSLSGIVFKTNGRLITARHVVEANNLEGFTVHDDPYLDIAYKNNPSSRGLKLGYTDKLRIEGAKIITSTVEEPEQLLAVPGGLTLVVGGPPMLRQFQPDHTVDYNLFVPGASGSPIIYKDHIIGLVPSSNVYFEGSRILMIGAIVFDGQSMKEVMERFGLSFDYIE